jgi:hypothetical protein
VAPKLSASKHTLISDMLRRKLKENEHESLFGKMLPQSVFIECITINNISPAPLVIFTTFIGFQAGSKGSGHAFAGAIIITLEIFFPCFLFTIVGHISFGLLVRNKVRLYSSKPWYRIWLPLSTVLFVT